MQVFEEFFLNLEEVWFCSSEVFDTSVCIIYTTAKLFKIATVAYKELKGK